MLQEEIILVNEADEEIGFMPKLEAHQKGLLHRAFSILIFNEAKELLIHQRAFSKYHSAGLWTNTCCSHPSKNEATIDAAHRRLQQEMGFDCPLTFSFKFQYKTHFENELIENELDHVFVGTFDGIPKPDPEEVASYKWISLSDLKTDLEQNPEKYTHWFKLILNEHSFSIF